MASDKSVADMGISPGVTGATTRLTFILLLLCDIVTRYMTVLVAA